MEERLDAPTLFLTNSGIVPGKSLLRAGDTRSYPGVLILYSFILKGWWCHGVQVPAHLVKQRKIIFSMNPFLSFPDSLSVETCEI